MVGVTIVDDDVLGRHPDRVESRESCQFLPAIDFFPPSWIVLLSFHAFSTTQCHFLLLLPRILPRTYPTRSIPVRDQMFYLCVGLYIRDLCRGGQNFFSYFRTPAARCMRCDAALPIDPKHQHRHAAFAFSCCMLELVEVSLSLQSSPPIHHHRALYLFES